MFYEASESDAQVELCAVLSGMLEGTIPFVQVNLVDDTAQQGNVYLCNTTYVYCCSITLK